MSRAIDTLKHEHDAIIAALNILDSLTQQMSQDQAVDANDIDALLNVFTEFADKCHHGKEEDLLFPALVKAGLTTDREPLAVMLREHAEGRRLSREMHIAATAPLDVNDFSEAARAYSESMRSHIEKENTLLFPMAEETLSKAQLDTLAEAFAEHEIKLIGPGRHDELHGVIKRLQKRYLM